MGSGGGGIISLARMVYRQYPGSVLPQGRDGIFLGTKQSTRKLCTVPRCFNYPSVRSTVGKLIYSL